MLSNPVKAKIRAGEAAFGTICALPSPEVVEVIGVAGYDCVLIDLEHGPLDVETVQAMGRACRATGIVPLARVPDANPKTILRMLDSGCLGVMVPQIETPEQAADVVAACRYPPAGRRSLAGNTVAANWGVVPAADHVRASNDAVLSIVQIETRRGLDAVEKIVRVPGLDMIFIGPNDLSTSLGHPGEMRHPEVQDAIRRILRAAKEAETLSGILALDPQDVETYRPQGAGLMLDGIGRLLLRAAQQQVKGLRDAAARVSASGRS
ncbi:MAG: HpcH/HpaI aldolase family protein [bacterium]